MRLFLLCMCTIHWKCGIYNPCSITFDLIYSFWKSNLNRRACIVAVTRVIKFVLIFVFWKWIWLWIININRIIKHLKNRWFLEAVYEMESSSIQFLMMELNNKPMINSWLTVKKWVNFFNIFHIDKIYLFWEPQKTIL